MALGLAIRHKGDLSITDNQAAITSSAWPQRQSGQFILQQISQQILQLRAQQVQLHLHWIPTR